VQAIVSTRLVRLSFQKSPHVVDVKCFNQGPRVVPCIFRSTKDV